MASKKDMLIRILQNTGSSVIGKQLAAELGVTTRSVITYIKQINDQSDTPVILSSQEGYSLNTSVDYMGKTPELVLPQDRQQRFMYLLKVLLLDQKDGINAFDLADDMMISYSMLKKEISGFNDTLKAFDLSIISRNNMVSISGREKNKRRVMSAFIRREQQGSVLNLNQLQVYFGEDMIQRISTIIKNEVHKGNSSINDFSLLNLLLHLSVITNRLLLGQSLSDENAYPIVLHESSSAERIAGHIISGVEREFGVVLNPIERMQMNTLIQAHIHVMDEQSADPAGELRDNELFLFLSYVMNVIKHTYYLDFTSPAFLVPFTLHVSNLLIRLTNNISIENPVKDTFRNTSAFLYDVAVEIMNRVAQQYNVSKQINDDEFSFIVMHLALEMERQRQDESSVRCMLYLPKYLNMEKGIPGKLSQRFEDMMEIVAVVNAEEEIKNYNYDLLVSFVNLTSASSKRFVKISPMLSYTDYSKLDDAITAVRQAKMLESFKTAFPFFFEAKNYFYCEQSLSQDEVIHLLCENLTEHCYVREDFEEAVIARERAISTAYINFAVPHAVCQSVKNQCVSVFVSPNGIQWADRTVNCVMLMSVSPLGLNEFQMMYNALVILLLETDCVEKIKKCNTFAEFQKVILTSNL